MPVKTWVHLLKKSIIISSHPPSNITITSSRSIPKIIVKIIMNVGINKIPTAIPRKKLLLDDVFISLIYIDDLERSKSLRCVCEVTMLELH